VKAAGREADEDRVDKIAASYVDRYVKGTSKGKRRVGEAWGKEIERLLKVEILPKLGDKRISSIKRADINGLLDAIVDRGSPITANRTFAVLRQLFNWALEREKIVASPMPRSGPAPGLRPVRRHSFIPRQVRGHQIPAQRSFLYGFASMRRADIPVASSYKRHALHTAGERY
jgi:hypothetical protein